MKRREAIAIIALATATTLSACSTKEETVAIEQTTEIATEDNDVAEVDLIENADDITDGKLAVAEETILLSYMRSGNGEYELENQEETTIEEYKMEKPLSTLVGTEIEIEITEEMVSETREDGSVVVSADDLDIQSGYTLQYSYDTESKEGKAIYMYEYLTWEGITEEDIPASGINIILEQTDGKYKVKGFEDIFGNNIDEIMLYRGEVVGWACGTADATEADFEFEDKARFSTDMELYPVLNTEYELVDEEMLKDVKDSYVVGIYGHKVPKQKLSGDGVTKGIYHVEKDKDGKTVLITDEGGKVDPATGEATTEKESKEATVEKETEKEKEVTKEKKPSGTKDTGETTPTTPGGKETNTTPTPKDTGETSQDLPWEPDPNLSNLPVIDTSNWSAPAEGGGGWGIEVE